MKDILCANKSFLQKFPVVCLSLFFIIFFVYLGTLTMILKLEITSKGMAPS